MLALEGDLGRERERADLTVMALRQLRDQQGEMVTELVRQGGDTARTRQIVEALAQRLGLDTDAIPPMPDVPFRRREVPAIEELERVPTRVDREELERKDLNGSGKPTPPATSLPITRSWRPHSLRDWIKLTVAFVVAITALAGAAQQIAQSVSRPPAPRGP